MRAWRALCGVLLLLGLASTQTTLTGEVLSVTTFTTCAESPLASNPNLSKRMIPSVLNNLNSTVEPGDTSPCGLLGTNTTVTELRLLVPMNMAAGADTLEFTITNLPNDAGSYSNSDTGSDCTGTLDGSNCQALAEPMTISVQTGQIVTMWDLFANKASVAYCYQWLQCNAYTDQIADASIQNTTLLNNIFNNEFGIYQGSCSEIYSSTSPIGGCYSVVDNSAVVAGDQRDFVCPTYDQFSENPDVQKYFPDYSPIGQSSYETFNADTCTVLTCPDVDAPVYGAYVSGYLQMLLPECQWLEMEESGRFLMNADVHITSSFGDSDITLSSLQNGAMLPDTTGLVIAGMIAVDDPLGLRPESLGGAILTCNSCPVQDGQCVSDSSERQCYLMSDIPEDLVTDQFTAQTTNPWDYVFAYARDNVITNFDYDCLLPTEKCRRQLLGVPPSQECPVGSWMYYNPSQAALMFGVDQCARLGMQEDSFSRRLELAELMCIAGLSGACIPGYQQVALEATQGGSAVTGLEVLAHWADVLAQRAALGTTGSGSSTQQSDVTASAGFGVPLDYNINNPQYWLDGYRFYKGGGELAEVQVELLIYVSGDYIGEVQSIATGKFLASSMVCNTPEGSASGSIVFQVVNTGGTAGNYLVQANFTYPIYTANAADTTSPNPHYGIDPNVTNVQQLQFSLDAGETSSPLTLGFSYIGGLNSALTANLALYGNVQEAFQTLPLLSTATVGCGISQGSSEGGVFGGVDIADFEGAGVFTNNTDVSNDDADNDLGSVCYAWEFSLFGLLPNGCTPDTFLGWINRIIVAVLLFVVLVFLLMLVIYSLRVCIRTNRANKYGRKALKSKKDALNAKYSAQAAQYGLTNEAAELAMAHPAGARAGQVLRQRKGGGAPATIFMSLVGLSLLALCAAQQVEILNVSSFEECVTTSSGLNCSATELATTIELRIVPPSGTASGDDTPTTATFNVALSTVPLKDSGDVQKGLNGTTCPTSDRTAQCQITVPAKITIEVDQPVYVYSLLEVPSITSETTATPYAYFYWNTVTFMNTETSNTITTSTILDAVDDPYVCTFISFTYNTANPADTAYAFGEGSDSNFFTDPIENESYVRCNNNAEIPQNLQDGEDFSTTFKGAVQYLFDCYPQSEVGTKLVASVVRAVYTAQYTIMQPMCTVYQISNPPQLAANIRVTVEIPLTGQSESLEIQTIQTGLLGSSAVSEPNRFVSAQVLRPEQPDGLFGPDIPGFIVICNKDGTGDLDYVPPPSMTTAFVANNPGGVNPEALTFNPYSVLPDGGIFTLPEPNTINQIWDILSGGQMTPDPYIMFAYVNTTQLPTYSTRCGGLLIPDNLYESPPNVMEFNSLLSQNQVNFPASALVAPAVATADQRADNPAIGTFSDLLTCVPGFGLSPFDSFPQTMCSVMGYFRDMENQTQALATDGQTGRARSLLVENLPYENGGGNKIWLRDNAGRVLVYRDTTAPALDTLLTISGDFLSYPETVPNGEIATTPPGSTYCTVNVTSGTVDGAAYYKVCNYDATGDPSSYILQVQCGLFTDFDATLGKFSSTTIFTIPEETTIASVQAQQCKTAQQSGPVFLQVATTEVLTNPDGSSNVMCFYQLLSDQTLNPAEVFLSSVQAICSFANSQDLEFGVNGTVAPQPQFIRPSPSPSATVQSNANESTTFTLAIIGGVILIGAAIALIAGCATLIRGHKQDKKLLDQTPVSASEIRKSIIGTS